MIRSRFFGLTACFAAALLGTGCDDQKSRTQTAQESAVEKTPGIVSAPTPTPTPTPTPKPTPTPSPTPIVVPYQKLETAKLYNGIELKTSIEMLEGAFASGERKTPDSYEIELKLKVRVPKASITPEELSLNTPGLSNALPGLAVLLNGAKISPIYDEIYRLKLARLELHLPRLHRLLSRHNFYDLETALELEHPNTKRKLLLVQADMDVDMDGSDSDRVSYVDGSIPNFQPMTSYAWDKQTNIPNPFYKRSADELTKVRERYAVKGLSAEENRELRQRVSDLQYEASRLAEKSFLVSETDPYVVIPLSLFNMENYPFEPKLGDFCVVVHGDTLYPAIVGDVGPTFKAGEASLRMAKEINSRANAYNRPVSDLTVTYLFFPGTADKPFGPPDLARWHERCEELLSEIGGYNGNLMEWKDLTYPRPTPIPPPTPTPSATFTPSPTESPGQTPSATSSPTPAVSATQPANT